MPRYKLTLEYDGTGMIGWQKQPGMKSVQGEIEAALQRFCCAEVEVVGAGRTDAGVHAVAQVAHIDLPRATEPFKIMQGINFYLFEPRHPVSGEAAAQDLAQDPALPLSAGRRMIENRIAITRCEPAADDFHARFSATRRHYLYRIVNRRARLGLEAGRAWHVVEPLDERAMQEAANLLIGHHDFTSFRDSECQAKSAQKTLDHLQVQRSGEQLWVTANARSFLHHQVRIMVGTLAQVGKGRWAVDDVKTALEAKDRSAAGPTAPPEGLYLVKVDY